MMKIEEILAFYDEQERIRKERPLYQREVTAEVVRLISHDPIRHNFIMYSQLNESNADEIIQREKDYYQQMSGLGLEWLVYAHDEPTDLGERLLKYGFIAGEHGDLLVLDLQESPQIAQPLITGADDFEIRGVMTSEEISHVVEVQSVVYGHDFSELQMELEENLALEPDGWCIYAIYAAEQPICGSWISLPRKSSFAGLWGGATLKQYRQRGLYSQMVAIRAQEAMARGYRFLMVYAGDMSRPILQKFGFQLLTHTYVYLWQPEVTSNE